MANGRTNVRSDNGMGIMIWSPLSQCIIKALKEGDRKKVEELFKIGWDKIEQRNKARIKKCWFHVGEMDYGMKWGVILFGNTVYCRNRHTCKSQ